MGYKLRPGKSIINPYDGTSSTAAYALIDNALLNKQEARVLYDLTIYASRAARAAKLKPLYVYTIEARGAEFTTHFSPTLATSFWAQAQAHLIAAGLATTGLLLTDWITDPLDASGEP